MQASASVTASGDSKAAIGEALKQALSGNRLQSISLHDERGDVLWLDEGALGPDEHNLVLDAVTALNDAPDRNFHFTNIGDGRAAAFLPARSPLNDLLGIAMIIADAKFLDTKGAAKFATPTTTNLMRRLAFLRRPPAPTPAPAPAAPPPQAPPANRVASPQAPKAPPARPPAPAAPAAGARPAASPARPAAAAPQRPPASPARPAAPPAAARPQAPARPAAPAARPAAPPAARPAAPPPRAGAPAPSNMVQRPTNSADSDSIAFEISDIDPKALLKGPAKQAAAEPKRPELRVIQTDRLPKLELRSAPPIPELIPDEEPPTELPQIDTGDEVAGDAETAEVEALDDPANNMNVEPEYVDETPQLDAGAGQFDFYGQIFELHVQQLVKLKGSGGTRRYEVLVRDAHADNEFGTAPDRVVQDVHDPSANSDLDRIVVEQLVRWMADHRQVWEAEPSSFSVNVGMGTIADPKFVAYVAGVLKNQKVPSKALGFEISEKSCVDQVREVDLFVQACEKLGCHVVLDDFTFHHNALRWLGSPALKFLKLDPKITAVAMKDKVPQAIVVAVTQASKVLGLSCVAKRVDTPAQRDWLSAVGLDYAQGFLLDQPKALVKLADDSAK